MKHRRLIYLVIMVAALSAVSAVLLRSPARAGVTPSVAATASSVEPIDVDIFYRQNDPAWADISLGSSDEKMAAAGCTVACLAMGLSSVDETVNPMQLVEDLERRQGFTDSGLIVWDSVRVLTDSHVRIELPRPSHNTIDAELMSGRPVITKILLNGSIPHWVLIVGKDNREYLIKDPLNPARTITRLSERSQTIEAIRTFRVN